MEDQQNSTPMSKYRCHKEVWALKIADVVRKGGDKDGPARCTLTFAATGFAPLHLEWNWHPEAVAGGYYVVYADGYTSFSPAKAFEEGYTRIEA